MFISKKMAGESSSIQVNGMQFSYDFQSPIYFDFNLNVAPRSRCLLLGANGSGTSFTRCIWKCIFIVTLNFCYFGIGKTTLLKILAGKHMVGGKDVVRVLNLSAFHDTHLVCSGDLAYLGESWSKNVGAVVSSLVLVLMYILFVVLFHELNYVIMGIWQQLRSCSTDLSPKARLKNLLSISPNLIRVINILRHIYFSLPISLVLPNNCKKNKNIYFFGYIFVIHTYNY